jgi:hypothetical protein
MKTFKFLVPAALAALLTLTFCHKKETVEVDNETQSVVDNAVAEQEFMGLVPATNNVAIKTKGTGAEPVRMAANCDTLTYISGDTTFQNLNNPPTFTFSFNNANCTPMADAKLREGTMKVTFFGRPRNVGSRMKIELQNFKAANADPNKKIAYICDSIVVKNVAENTNFREFNVRIYAGKCIGAGGSWTTLYEANRSVRHEYNGNIIKIWGSSNGTNRQGRKFAVEVPSSSPLTKHNSCQFISAGILNLTPEGFKTRTVDYTSGKGVDNCDDDATFTVNGNTVAFKLK